MKKLIAIAAIVTTVMITSTIDAYQVCSTALQVTFKNGVNLVLDAETGMDIYR